MLRAKHNHLPLENIDPLRTLVSVTVVGDDMTVIYGPETTAMQSHAIQAVQYWRASHAAPIPDGDYTYWCGFWYMRDEGKPLN